MRCRLLAVLLILGALALFPCARAEETAYVLDTMGSAVLATENGDILIPAGRFADIEPLGQSGLYAAKHFDENKLGLIDHTGLALTDFVYDSLSFDGAHVVFSMDGLYGVMDTTGSVLIQEQYTRLIATESGYLALKSDALDDTPDSVFFVTLQNEEHSTGVRVMFGLTAPSDGLSEAVSTDGLYGYLNDSGSWQIEPTYVWAGPFIEGRACVSTADGMGLIDKNGQWIIEPGYRRLVNGGSDKPCLAMNQDSAALLDAEDGTVIASFEGRNIGLSFAGDAILLTQNDQVSLIDGEGRILCQSDEALSLQSWNHCILRYFRDAEAPYDFINPDGKIIGSWQDLRRAEYYENRAYFIACRYDTNAVSYEGSSVVFYDEVAGSRRYMLIDEDGTVVLDDLISLQRTGNALLTAETEDWIGLIRPDGRVIVRLDREE